LTVALMPFFTLYLAAYFAGPGDTSAVVIYGAGIFLACLAWCMLWWRITGKPDLQKETLSRGFVRVSRLIYGVGPVGYLAATALATVSTTAAIIVFLGLPVLYYVPRGLPGEPDGPWSWAGLRPTRFDPEP